MTALAVMVAGAGIGLGVFLAVRAVFPRPVPLQRALADLGRPRRALVESETTSTTRMSNRIGRATISLFEATGLVDLGGLRQRLRALGKPVEVHAYEKMLGGLAGLFLPLGFAAILAAGGVTVPTGWVAVLAVGLGIWRLRVAGSRVVGADRTSPPRLPPLPVRLPGSRHHHPGRWGRTRDRPANLRRPRRWVGVHRDPISLAQGSPHQPHPVGGLRRSRN